MLSNMPSRMPMSFARPMMTVSGLQLALRAGVAAAIALAIGHALHLQFPLFVMIAAVIVTDLQPSQSRLLGFHRIAGTIVGAVLGAFFSSVAPSNPWTIGAGIAVAMLISHLPQGADGARIAGFVCGVVMLYQGDDVWTYAMHRFVETAVGIAVAWTVSHIPKLIKTGEKPDDVARP
jgi:uncharacterized membrane protein YgaE (UPF0421/DUF939 family)